MTAAAAPEAPQESAQPFSAKAVLWMILVGVFAFAAFTVLSAYAPDLRSGRDGRGHALSKSAIGFAGLVALAKGAGVPMVVSRGAPPPGEGLLILTPELGVDAEAMKEIIASSPDRSILVVLPKWNVTPNPLRPGWVSQDGLLPEVAIVKAMGLPGDLQIARSPGVSPMVLADLELDEGGFAVGPVDRRQTVTGAGWTPALVDADGGWVVARSKTRGNLLVVAEPDLLNTQGLKDLGRARMALSILTDLRTDQAVLVDVSLNGFARSRGVLKLAFEPPFLGATLCAVAAGLLMGLHAAARFGAPATAGRAFALGKHALADNSAALLRLAKREPSMAAPYADLNRQLVARAVGAPRLLDKAALDAVIDRLAVKAGHPPAAAAMTAEADRARDLGGLMAVARNSMIFDEE